MYKKNIAVFGSTGSIGTGYPNQHFATGIHLLSILRAHFIRPAGDNCPYPRGRKDHIVQRKGDCETGTQQ